MRRLRETKKCGRRCGAASLEVVMATAIALPLAILLLILGVQMCRYVFQGVGGMLLMPFF